MKLHELFTINEEQYSHDDHHEFWKQIQNRDENVNRLCAEICIRAGVHPKDDVDYFVDESKPPRDHKGWSIWEWTDDMTLVVLRDAVPKAGMYFSFRGGYIADAWLVDSEAGFVASDCLVNEPSNVWTVGNPEFLIAKDACEEFWKD